MPAKKKAVILEDAAQKGVEIPEGKTVPEIKEIVAEAAPGAEVAPPVADDAPDSVKQIAALDDPAAPLSHTPFEGLTEYAPIGVANPPVEAPSSDPGNDDDIGVALPGTPA